MAAEAGASSEGTNPGRTPSRAARAGTRRGVVLGALLAAVVVVAGAGADWALGGPPFTRSGGTGPGGGCNGPPVQLIGALSGDLDPRVNASLLTLSAEFRNVTAGCVTTTLRGAAATAGLAPLASGPSEFLLTTSYPTRAEEAAASGPVVYLPAVVGAIAIVYHASGLPDPLNLSASDLAGIFDGAIRNWSDPAIAALNPGGVPPSTGAVSPSFLSGSTAATAGLTAYLSATNASFNASVGPESSPTGFPGVGASGAAAMMSYIARTAGSIGYLPAGETLSPGVGLARVQDEAGGFAVPNATGLTTAATSVARVVLGELANGSATVTPGPNLTAWTAPAAGSYPLTTFDDIVLLREVGEAGGSPVTKAAALWFLSFLEWLTGSGQSAFNATGFVPLPSVLVAMAQSVLENVDYQGEPLLGGPTGDGEGAGEGGNDTGGEG